MLQVVAEQTFPNMMWFEDNVCRSWWACNTRCWRGRGVVAMHKA